MAPITTLVESIKSSLVVAVCQSLDKRNLNIVLLLFLTICDYLHSSLNASPLDVQ